jgi:hypothetical protein
LLWTLYQLDAGEDGQVDVPTVSVRPPEPEAPSDLGVEILLGAARRGFAAAILCARSLGLAIAYERPLGGEVEWPIFTVAMLVAAFVASGIALLWALVPSPDPLETTAIERRMQCAARERRITCDVRRLRTTGVSLRRRRRDDPCRLDGIGAL